MDPAGEILGFLTLAGPFWAILVLLAIGAGAAFFISKRIGNIRLRFLIAVAASMLVLVLPFADEIAGRLALSRLCDAEAGTKVYEIVALPKSYWDARGSPRFIRRDGSIDEAILPGYMAKVTNQRAHQFFPIDRFRFAYQATGGSRVLGEFIDFRFAGGWITRNFSIAPSAGASCDLRLRLSPPLSERVFRLERTLSPT